MTTPTYDVLIVGAGLSGLSVARFLRDKRPEIKLLLLEKNNHPGGAIRSHSEEGYLAEWGAHGFLDNCLESRVLVHLAGLTREMEKAPLKKFVRYICLNGALKTIPQSPTKIIRAPLIPLSAKLRVLADLWKKPMPGEPTVADWVRYRFGGALLPFADAVFTGTYAGDINRLTIDGVMAGVRAIERDSGSIIRGLWKKARTKDKTGKKKGLPAMTSFHAGMGRLAQGLASDFEANREIMYRTTVQGISRMDQGWLVVTGQNSFTCRHLVLALPVNQSLPLLNGLDKKIKPPPLDRVEEARIATVALGFTDAANIPFGFGYLAPESEERFALGALFSSHMFPGRAPAGHQLIEVLVGGRRHPERLELSDEELIAEVYRDLSALMDLPSAPSFSRVLRPTSGIPQLEANYPALLSWRRELHAGMPSLHICGFGWGGIGINDMTKEAWKAAKRILTRQLEQEEKEVKGVYF
jgi:oxygen-dependent protoporphyrinogen oxidase